MSEPESEPLLPSTKAIPLPLLHSPICPAGWSWDSVITTRKWTNSPAVPLHLRPGLQCTLRLPLPLRHGKPWKAFSECPADFTPLISWFWGKISHPSFHDSVLFSIPSWQKLGQFQAQSCHSQAAQTFTQATSTVTWFPNRSGPSKGCASSQRDPALSSNQETQPLPRWALSTYLTA